MYNRTTIMKTLLSYALLGATWIVIVTIIVYLWVAKALEPPFWSFIILLVTAVVPLAERLRIGNWFDFTRKVDKLTQEVNTNKKDIQQLGTQLTNILTQLQNVNVTRQAQLQIIANLTDPETAKAFAGAIVPPSQLPYPPQQAEALIYKDPNVIYFLAIADANIASADWPLRLCYAYFFRLTENRSATGQELIDVPLISIIEKLRAYLPRVGAMNPDLHKNLSQGIDSLARLIALRQDVANSKAQVPAVGEGLKLMSESRSAIISAVVILGSIVEAYAQLMNPPPRA
jgi:hypothetical protein